MNMDPSIDLLPEDVFRLIVEAAPTAILLVDASGVICLVNERVEALFGYSRNEMLGRKVEMLMPEYQKSPLEAKREQFPQESKTRAMLGGASFKGIRKDGKEILLEIGLNPIPTAKGTYIFTSIFDVSGRKSVEDRLQHSQKMDAIGKLAGGIAHDFNNLLTVIMGYSESLSNGIAENSPQKASVEEIRKAAKQASSIVNQLLAISSQQPANPVEINLNQVVMDMEKMIRRLVPESIEIMKILAPDVWFVKADAGQMQQVILNLLVNAAESMKKGRIIIETRNVHLDGGLADGSPVKASAGDYVLFSVTDNGSGMPAEIQGRIFDPFFTTKNPEKNPGLGLSACFGIVQQAGGHIRVDSEMGRGSVFKIYLPKAMNSRGAIRNEPADPLKTASRGGKILIVEDEELLRKFTASILSKRGFDVLEAVDGQEAWEILQRVPTASIDLIFADVIMPRMTGVDLARKVREIDPSARFLFTSGYTDSVLLYENPHHRQEEFLRKPFSPSELIAKIQSLLESGKSQR